LGFVSRRVDADLSRFKDFIEDADARPGVEEVRSAQG